MHTADSAFKLYLNSNKDFEKNVYNALSLNDSN